MLIGNKSDMVDKKVRRSAPPLPPPFARLRVENVSQVIDTARGKGLADEYGIRFLETSAKTGAGVEDAFIPLAKDLKKRLIDSTEKPVPPEGGGPTVQLNGSGVDPSKGAAKKNCCG